MSDGSRIDFTINFVGVNRTETLGGDFIYSPSHRACIYDRDVPFERILSQLAEPLEDLYGMPKVAG